MFLTLTVINDHGDLPKYMFLHCLVYVMKMCCNLNRNYKHDCSSSSVLYATEMTQWSQWYFCLKSLRVCNWINGWLSSCGFLIHWCDLFIYSDSYILPVLATSLPSAHLLIRCGLKQSITVDSFGSLKWCRVFSARK